MASGAVANNNIAVAPALTFSNLTFGNTINATTGSIGAASTQTILPATLASYYFRSKKTGDWNVPGTWESSADNISWYEASLSPTSAANTITIQATHTVTVTAAANADQMIINATGQLTVNSGITFTVANGSGADLTVDGYVKSYGTITTTGTVAFNSGSTYEHARDLGTVPTAIWDVNSTLYITGQTNASPIPSGLGQSFGNLTWNTTSLGGDMELNSNLTTINGNLTLQSTGTKSIRFVDGINTALTIGKNVIVSGGTYSFSSGNGIPTVTIGGNFDMSAGTFEATRGGGGPAISIGGYYKLSGGTFTGSTTGVSSYNINVTGNFTIAGGTFNGTTSSATGTNITVGGDMAVNSGNFYLTHTVESYLNVTGSINVSGGLFGIMNGGNKSSYIQCDGDFILGASGTFRPTNNSATQKAWRVRIGGNLAVTGTITGSYSNSANGNYVSFVLGGGTNSTPTVNYLPSSAPGNFTYNVFVEAGKTVTWQSNATISTGRVLACSGGNINLNNGLVITASGVTAIQGGYFDFNVSSYTTGAGTTNVMGSVASISVTGTITAGFMEITGIADDMTNIVPGMKLTGAGFTGNTYVVGKSPSSLYLSEAASSTGTGLSFTITSSRGTLKTANVDGITAQGGGNTGSVQTTTRIFSTSANYEYNNTTTAQNSGTGLPATVNDLTIKNGANPSSTNGVTLNNAAGTAVDGVLYLADGIVTTSAALPITINNTATSGVNRTSSTDETYVNGPIRRYLLSGNMNEYLFPTGKNTGATSRYKPVNFIPVSNTGGRFDAEYFRANPPQVSGPDYFLSFLTGIDKLEYWQFDRGVGSTTGKLRLPYVNPNSWRTADGTDISPCFYCNVAIVKRSATTGSGTWDFTGSAGTYSSTIPEYRDYFDAGDITSKTVTSFSPFTFGFSYNALLPVQLLSFEGKLATNNDGLLKWTVADIRDLAGFELQYSRDGRRFDKLSDISNNPQNNFKYQHRGLSTGNHYYRLLIKDKNGSTSFSQVVMLTVGKGRTQIIGLQQNPVRAQPVVKIVSASAQQACMILTDVLGKIIYRGTANLQSGLNQYKLPVTPPTTGMYFISIVTGDGEKATLRFVKE